MKMRIISGSLGRRQFDAPDSFATHPMAERVRGALFNALGSIEGLDVLEPFAGSGALSFEAISRGARSAVVIERDRLAQKIIEKNITALGLNAQIQLIKNTSLNWSRQHPEARFDVLLCDPPYNDLQINTISQLAEHVRPQGLLVLSFPASQSAPSITGVELINQSKKPYSGARLAYYRK